MPVSKHDFLGRLGLTFALLCPVPLFADIPEPFTARYAGEKRIALIKARATLDLALERHGDYLKYTSHSEVRWSFYRREFYDCSILELHSDQQHGDQLRPLEYQHIDEGDSDNDVHTRFDWQQQRAITQRADETEPRINDIQWPAWDPMSFQVALMAIAPEQAPGSTQDHSMVERGKRRDYRVTFAGSSADSESPGVYRVSSERLNSDKQVSNALWLAPDHHWVPQRIQIDDVAIDLQAAPVLTPVNNQPVTEPPTCERP